jgi:predicted outer membrane repeat protein
MFILNGMPVLANNVFHGNSADMGGAIFAKKTIHIQTWYNSTTDQSVSGPKPSEEFIEQLEKSAFQNQSIVSALPPRIINCTFVYNSAYNTGSALFSHKARANILNCIFWDNFSIKVEKPIVHYGPLEVNYSDVQGGWGSDTPNNTNINVHPEFADASSCCLSKDSPCIDKGHPSRTHSDPEDPENPGYALSPAWGTIRNDMGAYGGPCACRWNFYRPIEEKVMTQGRNELDIPRSLTLFQNYPNPFNPSTTISFSIDKSEFVTLRIYNMLGEEVETVISRQLAAGHHQIQWNAENLAGGMYLIRLETPQAVKIKKMVLLK